MATISQSFFFILPFLLYSRLDIASSAPGCGPLVADDVDRIQFALNLEFLEAEFFLHGALGEGLDQVAPQLARGGPPPIGARKANLDDFERRIIEEFGYQEVGHLRLVVIYIYIYIYMHTEIWELMLCKPYWIVFSGPSHLQWKDSQGLNWILVL